MRLENKVSLVTGASSGVGRATAVLLASEGSSVVCADVSDDDGAATVDEIRRLGGRAVHVHVDVRRMDQVEEAVRVAESSFGRLDLVVANAGTVGGNAVARPMEELSEEQWLTIIDVNLSGVFRTFTGAVSALRRAGGGAMSATASIAALTGVAGQSAYSASKGGIVSLVRALAYELALDGIRVNCVCPGGVTTNLLRDTDVVPLLAAARGRAADPSVDPHAAMNRSATSEDVAEAHLYLLSDQARMVNGQALVVDGGSMIANRWLVVSRD